MGRRGSDVGRSGNESDAGFADRVRSPDATALVSGTGPVRLRPRGIEIEASGSECAQARMLERTIGIGGSLAAPPLPHHRAYGSVHGGSTDLSGCTGFKRDEPSRRAFGLGTRQAGFGPLGSGAPGFTLHRRLQGQFQLDVLLLGPYERTVLLALSVVRAFAGEPTTMPSADFCAAITGLTNPLSPGLPDTTQTSRGKTDRLPRAPAGFTTPALDGYGLRDQ